MFWKNIIQKKYSKINWILVRINLSSVMCLLSMSNRGMYSKTVLPSRRLQTYPWKTNNGRGMFKISIKTLRVKEDQGRETALWLSTAEKELGLKRGWGKTEEWRLRGWGDRTQLIQGTVWERRAPVGCILLPAVPTKHLQTDELASISNERESAVSRNASFHFEVLSPSSAKASEKFILSQSSICSKRLKIKLGGFRNYAKLITSVCYSDPNYHLLPLNCPLWHLWG